MLLLEAHPFQGLDPDQVPRRREFYGPNVLPRSTRGGLVRKIARQFSNPLVYVLLAAAGITTYLGEQLDTSDIVLTDDNFATIEAAVEEGRNVFDNLTKFIVWTLPTNMGEGMVILVAILIGGTLPILPTQILWINMTTAVALGLMLAFEPREPGLMSRPPRNPALPLLTWALTLRALLVSALLVGGTWWIFEWELAGGASLTEARTSAVNLFVTVELFYLFSCRSLTRPVWRMGLFSNPWVIVGVLIQAAGQIAITYSAVMNQLFHTAPIGPEAWLRIFGLALLASLAVAVDKRFRRHIL